MGRRRRAVVAGGLAGSGRWWAGGGCQWRQNRRGRIDPDDVLLFIIANYNVLPLDSQYSGQFFFYPLKDFDSLFTFWLFLIYNIDLFPSSFLAIAKISLSLSSLVLSLAILNNVWQVYLNLDWLFEKLWAKVLISTWFQLFLEWQKWFQFCPLWMAVIFLVVCWHTLRVGSCCSSAHGSAEPI